MLIKVEGADEPQKPFETGDTTMSTVPHQVEKDIICKMYDIDDVEAKRSDDKLETLLEYVKSQSPDLSPENIRWTLRSLELKLGTPPIAEKRINYLARYAYLMSEKKQIDKELEKFY